MSNLSWTDDRVEELKRLNEESLSASQIARALGGVTRNAVIGKLNRLGYMLKSGTKICPGRKTQVRRAPVLERRPPRPERPEALPENEPPSLRVSIMDIHNGLCRWPHGDPQDLDNFHFCGHPTEIEHTYCTHHEGRAYSGNAAKYVERWNLTGRRAA
jgi:GcrA cell cycle regulator